MVVRLRARTPSSPQNTADKLRSGARVHPAGAGMRRHLHPGHGAAESFVSLYDQRRLSRSAGDRPAGARTRNPVAWMEARRVTD